VKGREEEGEEERKEKTHDLLASDFEGRSEESGERLEHTVWIKMSVRGGKVGREQGRKEGRGRRMWLMPNSPSHFPRFLHIFPF